MATETNHYEAPEHLSISVDRNQARLVMIALMMLFAFVSHFNRVSMAAAGDNRIMAQYGISPERMGVVYSAFLFTYTLFMIPGGMFIDRFGAKASLMVVGFGSGLFVAMTGLVGFAFRDAGSVFFGLILVRGLMGAFSAPLHPSLARMVGNWVPPASRSRTNGLVNGTA
ncbi:MFS transporter, partial [Singulisphaera rosea]